MEILCLGAHCDDIEIGCGGTLLELVRARPSLRVRWVIFSSDEVRAAETRRAAARLLGSNVVLDISNFRNGYFPYVGAQIKDHFEKIKASVHPDLIVTHNLFDRHQDHRTIAELTWNTFRDHLILEYEIPKYEGDLTTPNVYVPVSERTLQEKVAIIQDAFVSQSDKKWFTQSTFLGLARLRGIECNSPSGYAEGFHCRKSIVAVG